MIKQVDISGFTAFERLSLDFSPGINVFIGANGTGKTHLLKLMYSLSKSCKSIGELGHAHPSPEFDTDQHNLVFSELKSVFRPEGGQLIYLIHQGSCEFDVKLLFQQGSIKASWSVDSEVVSWESPHLALSPLLYLPARELLSYFPGFIQAEKNRALAFEEDQTYYDLCQALSGIRLSDPPSEEMDRLGRSLVNRLGLVAGLSLSRDRFYFSDRNTNSIEARLVAEGLRKVGSLVHLIANGSLTSDSILFWDEPEANLNPKLIKVVADFLLDLAGQGVQIFVATHDYLLTNELSLQAEYETEAAKNAAIRFFGLVRGEDGGVTAQAGDTLADLDQNPIMEEFSAFYERERDLFVDKGMSP